ncbi:MAG TPA: hypothetical protein DCR35_16265 [Runella sp.]|nr:hypothetical protein [Runella sp.]HAO50713.1 hypothetical protein [Runella sp.]
MRLIINPLGDGHHDLSEQTTGYAVNKSTLDSVLPLTSLQTGKNSSSRWLISEEKLREGLNWSKKEILNKNP